MFARLGLFLGSSIGRKIVMALTGLLLVVFLIAHLAGNLLIFKDEDGAAFNAYAHVLETNPLLPFAEGGLIVLFGVHLFLAFRVTMDNREARKSRYAVNASRGERTLASSSMFITGAIILAFVIVHLLDFRFNTRASDGLAAMLVRRLSEPVGAAIYLIGVLALGVHLSHAVRSALQSLGLNHPRFNGLIKTAGPLLAGVLFLGFASFPVLFFGASAKPALAEGASSPMPRPPTAPEADPRPGDAAKEQR
jgi:succinate dehydrogenase / fumarate reductase cytochrome b subunit